MPRARRDTRERRREIGERSCARRGKNFVTREASSFSLANVADVLKPRHCSGVRRESLLMRGKKEVREDEDAVATRKNETHQTEVGTKARAVGLRRARRDREEEWALARLSGDGCGFLRGFAGLRKNFAFGADPVFEWVTGGAVALEVDFVRA